MTPSILKKIVAQKRLRLKQQKQITSLEEIIELAEQDCKRPKFSDALIKSGLSIIGEVKKASPSKGIIKEGFDPVELAKEYESCVDAVSVLTEEDFFMGSPDYLSAIAQEINIPILRKDFIIEPYQIFEAKVLGASAVLLITAMLDESELKYLLETTHSLHMEALVETHDLKEAQKAVQSGARIIGINSRDLNTFEVNLDTTIEVAASLPEGTIVVSESGFHSARDIQKIKYSGANAVLVGESFMRCDDMRAKAKEFKDAYAH
jgi:indole-3-glycerol phosphate synthase